MDRFYGIWVVVLFAVTGAVGGEIVRAGQVLGGLLHGFEVERDVSAVPEVAVFVGVGAAEVVAVDVALACD